MCLLLLMHQVSHLYIYLHLSEQLKLIFSKYFQAKILTLRSPAFTSHDKIKAPRAVRFRAYTTNGFIILF